MSQTAQEATDEIKRLFTDGDGEYKFCIADINTYKEWLRIVWENQAREDEKTHVHEKIIQHQPRLSREAADEVYQEKYSGDETDSDWVFDPVDKDATVYFLAPTQMK